MIQHNVIIEKTWLKKHKEIIDLVWERILFTLNHCDHEEDLTSWLSEYYASSEISDTAEKKNTVISEKKSQKMKWKLIRIL